MAVKRPRVPERVLAPDAAHQLGAREHPGRLAGEHHQQVVLLGRQLDRTAGDAHLARPHVDCHRACPQNRCGAARGRAAKQRADPGTQLRIRERLADYFGSRGRVRPDPSRDWVMAGLLAQHQRLLDESVISAGVAAERGYWSAIKSGELNGRFGASRRSSYRRS